METPHEMERCTSTGALKMELMKGKEYASQLQALLDNPIVRDEDSALAQQLANNVFGSFNDSLVQLHLFKSLFDSTQIGPDKVADRASSGFDLGFQHFDGGNKKSLVGVIKNRRGCYRIRGQSESSSFTVSPVMDDGYAWRKYGQKGILNSKHPRCYFRCTHKYDQGCKATKQVQKIDDDQENPLYQMTYFGDHSCKNLTGDPQIIALDSETTYKGTNMISFQEKANEVPLSTTVQVKQEVSKGGETQSEVTTDNVSSNNYNKVMWNDDELGATGSSNHVEMMEYYPKTEFIQNQEAASASGSLVDLDIKTFDADIELFQW